MKLSWLFLVLAIVTCAQGATLDEGFLDPPHEVQPQVWWWFNSQASNACITRDLEAMKRVNISGFHIYSYGGSGDTSPTWRAKVRWALQEASRLGLDAVICIGAAGCESVYTKPENAQKELVFTDARVKGPCRTDVILPKMGKPKTPKNKDGSPKYYWDVGVFAMPDTKEPVPLSAVRDISPCLDSATGKVVWNAPRGAWRLIRIGSVPNIFGCGGCFIDHMSRAAFDEHWRVAMTPLLAELKPDERRALKAVMCDSWEAGNVSWTQTFPEDFFNRRGYELRPWLLTLAGAVIDGKPQTARFLRDFSENISDLLADNHYAHQSEIARRNGLVSIAEAAGPHQHEADILKLQGHCDVAMGEIWMPSAHRPMPPQRFMVRDAAMAAHLYGVTEVLCETFTTINTFWIEKPATMKPCVDRGFCDGLNRVCYHGMMLSPSLTAKPGFVREAGTHYNPQTTWWEQSAAFNLYLSRCAWMLHQGHFVADVLLYHGDGLNMFAGLKTPSDALGDGYDYDFGNTETLLQANVENGCIVLPSGMRYRVLMLSQRNPAAAQMNPGQLPPPKPLPPVRHALTLAAMEKLHQLVHAGATIAGECPPGPSSMLDDGKRYRRLAEDLWGPRGTEPAATTRYVGKGRVVLKLSAVRAILTAEGIGPDFACSGASKDGFIDWIHRATPDTDIYFVANRKPVKERIACAFRVAGKRPEIWDAVTGEQVIAANCSESNGVAQVTLALTPCGSRFVVFRNNGNQKLKIEATKDFVTLAELRGPWQVAFDPKWGAFDAGNNAQSADMVFDKLEDWTHRPEEAVRHYSGTAVYRKTFTVNNALTGGRQVYLDLGNVEAVAEVSVNGRKLGTLWTSPWQLDVTKSLKPGMNQLEVWVTNLWPNRLIGDSVLPLEKRFTKTNYNPYKPDSPLLSSGLLGPVRLVTRESE